MEPVAEPFRPVLTEIADEELTDLVGFDPAPPPPGPPFLPEDTPGLTPPRPLSRCTGPRYPELARRAGVEGIVALRALITESGEVVSIEVIEAPSPDHGFSEAAVETISCWTYEPGRYRGRPVAVTMTVIVEFELD
jgi:protein TonB